MRLSIMVSELTDGTTLASSPDGSGEWWRALFANCNEKEKREGPPHFKIPVCGGVPSSHPSLGLSVFFLSFF